MASPVASHSDSFNNNGPAWANASPQQSQSQQHSQVQSHLAPPKSTNELEAEFFHTPYSTIDEPVRETILRDVRAVTQKLKIVLSPLNRNNVIPQIAYAAVNTTSTEGAAEDSAEGSEDTTLSEADQKLLEELRDWDLWGPLLLTLVLALMLSLRAPNAEQSAQVFAAVFTITGVGGTLVTLNAQLLLMNSKQVQSTSSTNVPAAASLSFFQSLCVLGYSMFPLVLASLVIGILAWVLPNYFWLLWLYVGILGVAYVWAIRASLLLVSLYVPLARRALALYPVLLLYLVLGWMILLF